MPNIQEINERLKSNFGVNIYGEPNFRIVFSDKQTEVRYGQYNEFYGQIFVRTLTGFHERKKYPLVKERWIIERWYPAEYYSRAQIILPNTIKGDYELIYIFEDKNGNKLDVVDWAANIACNLSLKRTHDLEGEESSFDERKFELKDNDLRERQEEEKAIAETIDTTPVQIALHRYEPGQKTEGIVVPADLDS